MFLTKSPITVAILAQAPIWLTGSILAQAMVEAIAVPKRGPLYESCPLCRDPFTMEKMIDLFGVNGECSICLDKFEDPCAVPCGHVFCRMCIIELFLPSGKVE